MESSKREPVIAESEDLTSYIEWFRVIVNNLDYKEAQRDLDNMAIFIYTEYKKGDLLEGSTKCTKLKKWFQEARRRLIEKSL